jgi:ABC-2 type transport system permease protein
LGASFALRMVGDSSSGLHWLVWLSPLGWVEQFRPLTDPNLLAILPVLGLIFLTTAITLRLSATRDVGAATLPERSATRAHVALLGGSTGLALRLMRPMAFGWLFAVAAFSLLIGTTAASSTTDVAGTNGIEKAVERLGGHGSPVADYLGLTFLVIALLVALISAGQITAIRTEEADGNLENLLVRPKGRISWFAGRLANRSHGLRISGLVVFAGVRWRRCPDKSLATGHVRLHSHGSRACHQPRLVKRSCDHRSRGSGSNRRLPSVPPPRLGEHVTNINTERGNRSTRPSFEPPRVS